jgi:hypothetical protein
VTIQTHYRYIRQSNVECVWKAPFVFIISDVGWSKTCHERRQIDGETGLVWDPCYQGSEDLSAALLVTLVKRYIYYCKFRNMKVTIRLIKQFCINSDKINIIYLCICSYLTMIIQQVIIYSVEWKGDKWMTKWKGCGRKRSWLNLVYYPGSCLEIVRKTTCNFKIPGLRAEIWSQVLPYTKQEC